MAKPKVPIQHVVSRRAVDLLTGMLPGGWTKDEPKQGNDYGEDLWLGIALEEEMWPFKVTLQVKGTESAREPTTIRMSRTSLEHLNTLSNVGILVLVNTLSHSTWIVPATDHRTCQALRSGDDKVSIRLDEADRVVSDSELAARLMILGYRKWWSNHAGLIKFLWIRLEGEYWSTS